VDRILLSGGLLQGGRACIRGKYNDRGFDAVLSIKTGEKGKGGRRKNKKQLGHQTPSRTLVKEKVGKTGVGRETSQQSTIRKGKGRVRTDRERRTRLGVSGFWRQKWTEKIK